MFEWFTDLLNSVIAWFVSILVSMGFMDDPKAVQKNGQPQPPQQQPPSTPEFQNSE